MQHTLGNAAHQFRLSLFQGSGSSSLVAGGDGFFDFTQVGADARTAGFVDLKAGFVLTGALLGWGGELAWCGPSDRVDYVVLARKPDRVLNRLILAKAGLTRMYDAAYKGKQPS